ncbi:WGR domain-containing protein [bacterium]|nr:WGR domain-containing protein [bacterium]
MELEPRPFLDYDIRELVCIVQELNRKRFYRIEIVPGLFGPLIIRAWGRIGCKVRVMVEHFASLEEALSEANKLYRSKKKKGYGEVDSIIGEKIPVHPGRAVSMRTVRVEEDEPSLPLPGLY